MTIKLRWINVKLKNKIPIQVGNVGGMGKCWRQVHMNWGGCIMYVTSSMGPSIFGWIMGCSSGSHTYASV